MHISNVSRLTVPMLTAFVVGLTCITSTVLSAMPARADVLFQTAILGPSSASGVNIDSTQYVGARFQTSESFQLTSVQINARITSGGNGLLFAAIVPLSSFTAFPNAGNPAFIADDNPVEFHTFTAPIDTSTLVTIPFSAQLSSGTYALVFGSGEFGATGIGIAPQNGTDIGTPSYFFASRFPDGSGIFFTNGGITNTTFIVNGTPGTVIVPEPGSLALTGIGALTLMGTVLRRRKAA